MRRVELIDRFELPESFAEPPDRLNQPPSCCSTRSARAPALKNRLDLIANRFEVLTPSGPKQLHDFLPGSRIECLGAHDRRLAADRDDLGLDPFEVFPRFGIV